MVKTTILLSTETGKILHQLGENIKLAQLRRNLSQEIIAHQIS